MSIPTRIWWSVLWGLLLVSVVGGCVMTVRQVCTPDAQREWQHCVTTMEHDVICNGSCRGR